jgi:hypothetical protein
MSCASFARSAVEPSEELARARLGDRADVVDHLLARHADAVVGDRDRARLLVVGDADLQLRIVLEQRRVGERLEPQLVGGIGGVRDQLPQEDLLVAVQGVHHQVEELRYLGLEVAVPSMTRACLPRALTAPGHVSDRRAWRRRAGRPQRPTFRSTLVSGPHRCSGRKCCRSRAEGGFLEVAARAEARSGAVVIARPCRSGGP